MIRPLLIEALGNLAHARIAMQGLELAVLEELRSGYRPTYRGNEWSIEQFADLHLAFQAMQLTWNLAKAVQFPETREGRRADGRLLLEELYRSYDDTGDGGASAAELGPGDEPGHLDEDGVHLPVKGLLSVLDSEEAPV